MGSAGIRRRRRKNGREAVPTEVDHTLGASDGMSPGDQRRVLGQSTWGDYSWAGRMERRGFFLRQLKRDWHLGREWWRSVVWALCCAAAAVGVIAASAFIAAHV